MTIAIPRLFPLEVSKRKIAGIELVGIASANPKVGLVFTDVSDFGDLVGFTTPETWEVVSSEPNDTSAGSGAREVEVVSLDTSFNEQKVIATLNGTTPVILSGTHRKTRSINVIDSGSSETNEGTITVRPSGGGNTRLQIQPELSNSFSSHFTVPAGKTVFIVHTTSYAGKGDDAQVFPKLRLEGTNTWLTGSQVYLYQNSSNSPLIASDPIPEKTDIKLEARATNPSGAVQVSGSIQFYMINEVIPLNGSLIFF